MPKVTSLVAVVLFDQSFTNDFKVIHISGPASPRAQDIRAFDAELISQRIQAHSESGDFVPEAIYQVDAKNNPLDLSKLARNRPRRPLEGHLTKGFFHPNKMNVFRVYFAAYAQGSPAPTTVRRTRSAEANVDAANKPRAPLTVEAAATRLAVKLRPVKINMPGYADAPIYIVGDDTGRLDLSAPPSDFERCLFPPRGKRYLFSDPTAYLSQLFESSGDKILGVYTPTPADLDAALSASMLAAYTDRSKESQYPQTFGKLAVGPAGCSSYPPSQDFVMNFDFAELAVETLNLYNLEMRLSRNIHSCVKEFILKYDKYLHFGPPEEYLKSADGNGHAALRKVLKHIEKQSDSSRVFMIIRNYDTLRNLAEAKSMTLESPTNSSQFPSPGHVTDTFRIHLYDTVFHFLHVTGTISKLFLFGTSPAFSADLCPCAHTDLTTCGVVGVAGITSDQVKVYLSVAVGDKSVIGLDNIHSAVCYILPGYVYAPDTPAQYPRRLLHTVLPALNSDQLRAAKDSEAVYRVCRPVVDDFATPCMSLVVKTMYIRGKYLWQTPMDALRVQRRVPVSRHHARFRHRYSDFKADLSNGTSQKKTVFVPTQPDPFFSYCLDAGYLTVSFAEDEGDFEYTFPGASAYAAFFYHITNVVDCSGLAIRKPFDGSPEWIFDAMDTYLRDSQDTLSNGNAPENTFQSLRTSMMHIAEAHTGPHTYDAVMEAEMADKQRADSVVLLPQRRATIIIEDKTIRLFDLVQGITGHKFKRWDSTRMVKESQLRNEDWKMAEAVATHLRKLDPSVFTEARLPDVMPDPNVPVRALDDLPTKLEDMFFVGWVDNVWGRYSIFKLWFSAEEQGQKYVSALDCRQVDDNRFHCRPCTSGEENFITVIIVIVVGAVRVWAQRSRLTTNKSCANILEHTRENPI